jgi:hypothetical protein
MSSKTVTYTHNPFVINRYSFKLGGPNDLYQVDLVDDRKQGFGVPAKSVVVQNIGGGVSGDYLHIQYAAKKQYYSPEVTLYEGEKLIIKPEDGIIISYMILWADSYGLSFSLIATPGIWEYKELSYGGYIKSKETTIDDTLSEVTF